MNQINNPVNQNDTVFSMFNNVIGHPDNSELSDYDKQLYITSCGNSTPKSYESTAIRKNGRPDYHIIYVKTGSLSVVCGKNNTDFILKDGDIMFIPFMEPHQYTYKIGGSYYWLHFKGTQVENLIKDLSLEKTTKIHAKNSYIEQIFKRILHCSIGQKPLYHKKLSCTLLELLTYVSESSNPVKNEDNNFDSIISLFHYPENSSMTVNDYARLCNLSKSRFIKKFKKATGYTPNALKTKYLIENIKWQLENTSIPISNIPLIYNFSTPSYFYTLFKKHTGQTPSEYREAFISKNM